MNPRLFKQCVAEFIGTFALIFIGVGAIYHNAGLLAVALAHGLTIAVMASATGAISGGHLNPAVTFGLFVGGKINAKNAAAYWVAQLAGASVAAFILLFLFSNQIEPGNGKAVMASTIVANGTPDLPKTGINMTQGIVIEMILTFFLVFVVYGTAVDARAPKIAGLAIGLTVTLDILFGGPFTGAAMNPARTFGPALASGHWNNQLVYWIGPLLGGGLAGLIYGRFLIYEEKIV
ncbi:MAG: aquaporin [Verrucomicrobiota bacterium]|nr:aquaporin [Verrucomicrobiota bacterium]